MLARVLIVVLLILNAGVGLWWWSRPAVAPAVVEAQPPPPGVPLLALVAGPMLPEAVAAVPSSGAEPSVDVAVGQELEQTAANDGADVTAADMLPLQREPAQQGGNAVTDQPPAIGQDVAKAAPVCARLVAGHDAPPLERVRQQLGARVSVFRPQTLPVTTPTTWRVLIPPAASRQEAERMAARIAAAGFADRFVINQGELMHAVALGQFRNRDGAQRRLDALVAAGFPAIMQASAASSEPRWQARLRLADGLDLPKLRAVLAAGITAESLDCGSLR